MKYHIANAGKMNLFKIEEKVEPFKWDEHAVSLTYNEKDIIRWIILLHNNGKPFDVDPTYSTGRFWDDIPGPRLKFDIKPQVEDVIEADARKLPLPDSSVESIMFDPPFVVAMPTGEGEQGIIRNRFGYFKNIPELWSFYKDAMKEFKRILKTKGILVFKCQDTIDSGKQYMSHFEIMKYAEELGYYCKDFFILGRTNVMFSPNMKNQQHARKNHCYFIVFVKTPLDTRKKKVEGLKRVK